MAVSTGGCARNCQFNRYRALILLRWESQEKLKDFINSIRIDDASQMSIDRGGNLLVSI